MHQILKKERVEVFVGIARKQRIVLVQEGSTCWRGGKSEGSFAYRSLQELASQWRPPFDSKQAVIGRAGSTRPAALSRWG